VNGSDLDRFYDVPASVTARLVGGPFDGEERPFPAHLLESVIPRFILAELPTFTVADFEGPPQLLKRVAYGARRDAHGFLSRDDVGRVRFDFLGPG
jgi:hypothetical protein